MSTKERQRVLYNFHMPGKTNAKGPASLCAEAGPLIWLPFKISDQKKEKGEQRALVGARPLHLLSQNVWSLESPTGAFVADANAIITLLCRGRCRAGAAAPQRDSC